MEKVSFNGWDCIRLANAQVELIITRDVGPRVIRFAFIGGSNVFCEFPGQQGGKNESEWMIRGGHRLWVAPEAKPWSYELDNEPYAVAEEIPDGVLLRQAPGAVTKLVKQMEITLDPATSEVRIRHTLTNAGAEPVSGAPWALSVMGLRGQAIIPLPKKIPHTERLTHNQHWSLWGYTDFSDPRWTLGGRYLFLRQDPSRSPTKLGTAHEEKWVAYQIDGNLFVKYFDHITGAEYPDGGCSFATFTNEEFLELESIGPMQTLAPGTSMSHDERWRLFKDIPLCVTEDEVDARVRPLV